MCHESYAPCQGHAKSPGLGLADVIIAPATPGEEETTGLAGLTTRGSNRMYTPKRLRPGGVWTEWAEDFPVHHLPKLSARMLRLKNSFPSPLCLLYNKV